MLYPYCLYVCVYMYIHIDQCISMPILFMCASLAFHAFHTCYIWTRSKPTFRRNAYKYRAKCVFVKCKTWPNHRDLANPTGSPGPRKPDRATGTTQTRPGHRDHANPTGPPGPRKPDRATGTTQTRPGHRDHANPTGPPGRLGHFCLKEKVLETFLVAFYTSLEEI